MIHITTFTNTTFLHTFQKIQTETVEKERKNVTTAYLQSNNVPAVKCEGGSLMMWPLLLVWLKEE